MNRNTEKKTVEKRIGQKWQRVENIKKKNQGKKVAIGGTSNTKNKNEKRT